MPRPGDPLPKNAARVVKASLLPAGHKLVWLESFWLDDPTDGCTLTARTLGARLRLKRETVQRYRQDLTRYGLLASEQRVGNRTHWYCTLPPEAIPPTILPHRLDAALLYVRALDRAIGGGTDVPPPVERGGGTIVPRGVGSESHGGGMSVPPIRAEKDGKQIGGRRAARSRKNGPSSALPVRVAARESGAQRANGGGTTPRHIDEPLTAYLQRHNISHPESRGANHAKP